MSWLAMDDWSVPAADVKGFAGLGCCADCPPGVAGCSGLGQASDPVTGVVNLLQAIVGAGTQFIPETKEMKRRREQELEASRLEAELERIRATVTTKKFAIGAGVVAGGLGLLWLVTRKKKK